MRFTAFVATWRAAEVVFWLAGGATKYREGLRVPLGTGILVGDNSRGQPIRGTKNWTPISFTAGPVPCGVTQLSYGIILNGGGDVWLYKPRLEVVAGEELPRDIRRRQGSARICKKALF